jgi:nucleotide-binding universal stress UspA family protein
LLKIRKILCPLDFSSGSLRGLKEAIQFALHFEAELCLLHIVHSGIPWAADAVGYLTLAPELHEIPHRNAEKKLREMVSELQERGVHCSYKIGTGEAGLEIVRWAEELQSDLIVIASHGWTGWKRILFGSVAEKVVRHARCRVLTVPVRRRSAKRIQGQPAPVIPIASGRRRRLAAAARSQLSPQPSS